ncbi:MAG TPA: hypothetical protein EYQ21_01660 [Flavobacteriales bacterium]|nr:hypothetical protein [Flavobacteriales bacterium]HIL26632.1 hypothetical protein [Nitrospinaceae bacterium]
MKIVKLILSIVTLTILSFCSSKSEDYSKKVKVVSIANSPSEMAILMREMDARLFEIEGKYEKTGVWPELGFEFPLILDQNPTAETMMSDVVTSLSPVFADILTDYNQAPSKEGLDKIVQACLTCHYQSCPGPLVRIEKHIFDADY